jgi:hypothetical protein
MAKKRGGGSGSTARGGGSGKRSSRGQGRSNFHRHRNERDKEWVNEGGKPQSVIEEGVEDEEGSGDDSEEEFKIDVPLAMWVRCPYYSLLPCTLLTSYCLPTAGFRSLRSTTLLRQETLSTGPNPRTSYRLSIQRNRRLVSPILPYSISSADLFPSDPKAKTP